MFKRALTESQQQAAETLARSVAVTASAGSGKTTVLVERYLNLVRSGIKADQILAVTFTNEAADQLRERIQDQMQREERFTPEQIQKVERSRWIGTIHSFCYQVLQQFGSLENLSPIERIIESGDFLQQFDTTYREWRDSLSPENWSHLLKYFGHRDLKPLLLELHQKRFSLKLPANQTLSASARKIWDVVHTLLIPPLRTLSKNFWSQGSYLFDDLEYFAITLLEKQEEARHYYRENLRAIMVDEFQDTSRSQWRILQQVIGSHWDRLFIVGDPKQSIYRFRQADVRLFKEVSDTLAKQLGSKITLQKNFRTESSLLEAINHASHKLFRKAEIPFEPMEGAQRDTKGRYEVHRYEGGTSRTQASQNEQNALVSTLRPLLHEGIQPGQIAILFRVSDRIASYAKTLEQHHIPTTSKKTGILLQVYDVLDLCNYLRALQNPEDDFYLASFLISPFVGFDAVTLNELFQRKENTLLEKLFATPAHKQQLAWFYGLIDRKEQHLETVLQNLFEASSHFPTQTDAFISWLENLKEVETVADAVERIAIWEKEKLTYQVQAESQENAVQLMTVHAAKGLEFPHVFLVDCLRQAPRPTPYLLFNQKGLPEFRYRQEGQPESTGGYRALRDQWYAEDIEESKRILYVAMTRAQHSLNIFLPKERKLIPKESWGHYLLPEEEA